MATRKFEIIYAAHTTVVLNSIVFKSKTRQRDKIKKKQQKFWRGWTFLILILDSAIHPIYQPI